jgi:DNA-binding GntR family transcriptional regulator
LAGRDALLEAYRRLAIPGILLSAFAGYVLSDDDQSFEHEHEELIKAYEQGDANLARDVVMRHSAHIKTAARKAIESATETD